MCSSIWVGVRLMLWVLVTSGHSTSPPTHTAVEGTASTCQQATQLPWKCFRRGRKCPSLPCTWMASGASLKERTWIWNIFKCVCRSDRGTWQKGENCSVCLKESVRAWRPVGRWVLRKAWCWPGRYPPQHHLHVGSTCAAWEGDTGPWDNWGIWLFWCGKPKELIKNIEESTFWPAREKSLHAGSGIWKKALGWLSRTLRQKEQPSWRGVDVWSLCELLSFPNQVSEE